MAFADCGDRTRRAAQTKVREIDVAFETATQNIDALRARRVSAVELLDQSIARIKTYDDDLNAVVVRDFERARVAAVSADAALAQGDRRPLLGLPITVKEAFNVAGLTTTWGIPGTGNLAVGQDSVAIARLKSAGAIIVGKTNVCTQLADWQTFNPVYGTTNNPWDLRRTPGGSSGGSAAALAAGFVSLELGSDLSGSLRIPAHCCGIFAHKPTFGLVPTRGFVPPGVPVLSVGHEVDFSVLGPMARSAADLSLALDVLAGPDDAQALAYRLALPAPRHAELGCYRILVLDQHPLVPTSNAVSTAIHRFAGSLQRAGCKVDWHSPLLPDLERSATTFAHLLLSFFGADMPDEAYEGLKSTVAGIPAGDRAGQALEHRGLVSSHRDWIGMDRVRLGIEHQWRQFFQEWDVVLCPVLPTTASFHDHSEMDVRRIDIDGTSMPYKAQAAWMSVASVAGLPATTIPIGLCNAGLPVGMQVIGPYLEDRTTIRFAELAEREFGGFVVPPAYGTGVA
jgi:amidase